MKIDNVLTNMQEATEGLNALHALADMAQAVSVGRPDDPRTDYLKSMAMMTHSLAEEIELALADAATELIAASKVEAATA